MERCIASDGNLVVVVVVDVACIDGVRVREREERAHGANLENGRDKKQGEKSRNETPEREKTIYKKKRDWCTNQDRKITAANSFLEVRCTVKVLGGTSAAATAAAHHMRCSTSASMRTRSDNGDEVAEEDKDADTEAETEIGSPLSSPVTSWPVFKLPCTSSLSSSA